MTRRRVEWLPPRPGGRGRPPRPSGARRGSLGRRCRWRRRRRPRVPRRRLMQLDVVTLFPEWFEWFRGQRHVANALTHGHELRTLNPREHTPLSGGQVDDTPFGGGAGMVLRVDVMDAALRGFYGVDPVELRHRRRVLALTPGGRMLDDGFVEELAAERAITRRPASGAVRAAASAGRQAAVLRYHEPSARDRSIVLPRLLFAMSTVIDSLERAQLRRVPQFAAGDRVRVHFQVIEGTRRRTQVFEGVVIKRQGHGLRETFTVRKQSFGVGVERTFPLHSPKIEKIDLTARGDVRRAKLYYLRGRVGKRARVRERRYTGPETAVTPGLLHDPVAALEAEAAAAGEAVDAEGVTAEEVVDAGGAADTAA